MQRRREVGLVENLARDRQKVGEPLSDKLRRWLADPIGQRLVHARDTTVFVGKYIAARRRFEDVLEVDRRIVCVGVQALRDFKRTP